MATHVERLLFTQGGRCFFCGDQLSKSDASVEHLVAQSKSSAFPSGGSSHDDNCVACCKALNHLLGSKSVKDKFGIVLAQQGKFRCPAQTIFTKSPASHASKPATPSGANPSLDEPKTKPINLGKVDVFSDPAVEAESLCAPARPHQDEPTDLNYLNGGRDSIILGSAKHDLASPVSGTGSNGHDTLALMSESPAPHDRRTSIAEAPPEDWPTMLRERLEASPNNRPAKLTTLRNFIRASLTPHQPTEAMVSRVLKKLSSEGALHVVGDKVHYGFADVLNQDCPSERLVKVTECLIKAGKARPRKTKTLATFASASLSPNKPKASEIIGIVESLRMHGYVIVDGDKVSYKLPKAGATQTLNR